MKKSYKLLKKVFIKTLLKKVRQNTSILLIRIAVIFYIIKYSPTHLNQRFDK